MLVVFCCVAVNHLGLIPAVEKVFDITLPIINCPRCFSFWAALIYGLVTGGEVLATTALAFAGAWLASWLELGMGYTDTLYDKIYDTIYKHKDNQAPADDR